MGEAVGQAPQVLHDGFPSSGHGTIEPPRQLAAVSTGCNEGLRCRTVSSAMGTAPGQLEFHVRAALNTGVTREEIIEIVLQVSVYAGVPSCMNAITAAKSAFAAYWK